MRYLLALVLALALSAPACAQIYPGYGTPTLLGNGSAAAPAYSFAADATTGIWRHPSGSRLGFAITGSPIVSLFSTEMRVGFNVPINWASGDPDSVNPDAGIKRIAAGTLGVTAGGATATFANVGGVLFLEANNVTQSAVSQNLHSYTVPASVMTTNGKALRVTALFLSVNNANAKAIGFTICGGSLTFNATASIAGALRATAYIVHTAANTWTTSVTIEEGLASGTLTQAKLSGTYNSTPACTDGSTNTIAASVNTAGATDTSSGFFMVELLN